MAQQFEWDYAKARENLRKHGVSFEQAGTAFADPLAVMMIDDEHSDEEQRFILVGQSYQGQTLVVVYTERNGTFRLISARPATRRERWMYEESREH